MASCLLTLSALLWNFISSRTLHSKGFAAICIVFLAYNQLPPPLHLSESLSLKRVTELNKKKSAEQYCGDREILRSGFGYQQTQMNKETQELPLKSIEVRGHRKLRDWAMPERAGLCSPLRVTPMKEGGVESNSCDVVREKKEGCQVEQWILSNTEYRKQLNILFVLLVQLSKWLSQVHFILPTIGTEHEFLQGNS